MHVLEPAARKAGLPLRFAATKMVEGDPLIERSLALPAAENAALNQLVDALEREGGLDREAAMANMRFSFIERLCATTVVRPHESREHKRSVAADRILTGRFTAIPCFILIMAFVFLMTFSWLGAFCPIGSSRASTWRLPRLATHLRRPRWRPCCAHS